MAEKICNTIICIILVGVFVVLAVLGLPLIKGQKIYAVLSGSMEPTYNVGSVVVVEPITAQEAMAGDAITFRGAGGTFITHRVIEKVPALSQFITQGDANPNPDFEPVAYSAIVGKVLYSVPHMGFLAMQFQSSRGILLGACVLILIIVLFLIPEIFKLSDTSQNKISSKKSSGSYSLQKAPHVKQLIKEPDKNIHKEEPFSPFENKPAFRPDMYDED